MRTLRRILATSTVLSTATATAFIGLTWATPAFGASTLVVDDNLSCNGATYSTISAAVADASPGDTIRVCKGVYAETVDVDKSLTFLGPEANVDGRGSRPLVNEASVVSQNGDFVIEPGVSDVTINGFTLRGAGIDSNIHDAIEAFRGGSGFTIIDNVIRDNLLGINLQNPDKSDPTEIADNAFINNSLGSSADGGTAIFISNGPANSTTIEDNRFTTSRETAINFSGDGSNPSQSLIVADNTSRNDATFVVATNSTNAVIADNHINYSGSTNGSGILDFGSNTDLRIDGNIINGGDATGTSGIRVANDSGTASTGTTIISNHVLNRYNGIRITDGYSGLYVAHNLVKSSDNDGILAEGTNTSNVFFANNVSATANADCVDQSTGSLTAGTANTWRKDTGASDNSNPAAICPAP